MKNSSGRVLPLNKVTASARFEVRGRGMSHTEFPALRPLWGAEKESGLPFAVRRHLSLPGYIEESVLPGGDPGEA